MILETIKLFKQTSSYLEILIETKCTFGHASIGGRYPTLFGFHFDTESWWKLRCRR